MAARVATSVGDARLMCSEFRGSSFARVLDRRHRSRPAGFLPHTSRSGPPHARSAMSCRPSLLHRGLRRCGAPHFWSSLNRKSTTSGKVATFLSRGSEFTWSATSTSSRSASSIPAPPSAGRSRSSPPRKSYRRPRWRRARRPGQPVECQIDRARLAGRRVQHHNSVA